MDNLRQRMQIIDSLEAVFSTNSQDLSTVVWINASGAQAVDGFLDTVEGCVEKLEALREAAGVEC